jgi:hypothetical protein
MDSSLLLPGLIYDLFGIITNLRWDPAMAVAIARLPPGTPHEFSLLKAAIVAILFQFYVLEGVVKIANPIRDRSFNNDTEKYIASNHYAGRCAKM